MCNIKLSDKTSRGKRLPAEFSMSAARGTPILVKDPSTFDLLPRSCGAPSAAWPLGFEVAGALRL